MRPNKKASFISLILSSITLPICAARTDSASWTPTQPMTIGNTEVEPGTYQLRADEEWNEVDIMQGGKVIAEVPCYWRLLPKKPGETNIKTESDLVTEVQFRNRPESILFFEAIGKSH